LGGNNGVEYIDNMKRMLDVALVVLEKGHLPYIPCLDFLLSLRSKKKWKYDDYYNFNKPWIEVCDALLFVAPSNGTLKERDYARRIGKIIFMDVKEIKRCSK
jgi:hypothetical protein